MSEVADWYPRVTPAGYTGFVAAAGPVNLSRDITSPGLAIGDIAITSAGAVYEWNGSAWASLSISGGGGAAQTPWTSAINGGGFALSNVGDITLASTKRFLGIGAFKLHASGSALLASTPDYAGQINVAADGMISFPFGTLPANHLDGVVLANAVLYYTQLTKGAPGTGGITAGNVTCGTLGCGLITSNGITANATAGAGFSFTCSGATFTDNVIDLTNSTPGGYAAIAMWHPTDGIGGGRALAVGVGPSSAANGYQDRAYFGTNPNGGTNVPLDFIFAQERDEGSGYLAHARMLMDATAKTTMFYGWSASAIFGPTALTIGTTGQVTFGIGITGTLTGNASTATALATARAINGTNFDGTAAITVTAAAGTLTGATLAANVLASSLTSVGTLSSLTTVGLLTITQATANAGILASTGYSLTGSNATSLIDLAGTWNTSGNPVALRIAIANTASGATSKFLSFLAGVPGTTEKFSISKSGVAAVEGGSVSAPGFSFIGGESSGLWNNGGALSFSVSGTERVTISSASVRIGDSTLTFGTSPSVSDTILARDTANTLARRNSTNAQKERLYNTFTTVLTVGEWFKLDWITTANQMRLGNCMGTTTGTARVLSIDYGGLEASPTAAITVPITSGPITFGGQAYAPTVRTAQTTVANLPSASTEGAGATAFVTDANATFILGLGVTVVGGGANKVPVYSDGTNWIVG